MKPRFWVQRASLVAAVLLIPAALCRAAETPTLERGLMAQAATLIKHFKAKKCRNVGVLKFLIARAGEEKKGFRDNAGTLNMLLARRLEVALVLANDRENPVGIIRNASAVAARTRDANHLSLAGRKKLFEPDYPLAWGKTEVKADAFVTGTAQVSKDLRTITVSLLAFDRASKNLVQVGEDFTVRSDAGKLAEMNESFVMRGLFDDGKVIKTAARVKQGEAKHPLKQTDVPVRLDVLYDGKPIKIVYKGGRAFIPELSEGRKVAFRLHRDDSKVRYGVVLKVNGENTILRQRLPELECRRWILAPGSRPITISGFQMDNETAQEFRVLSPAESKEREVYYGSDVGTISLTVFRERQGDEIYDPDKVREQRRLQAVAGARLPDKKDSYQDLKSALLAEANKVRGGGLIGEGKTVVSRVRVVKFNPDPTPVMSVVLIYYRPGKE